MSAATYHRGEWVVYSRYGEVRTGRVESDENGCGVIVDDQDDAVRTIVARDQLRAESEHEQDRRVSLGYHAQDLGSTIATDEKRCFCPDDCGCRKPWRPTYCGCNRHES